MQRRNVTLIEVTANESLRNVAKDALKGMQLLPNTVIFGINGAGKSTVCEVLSKFSQYTNADGHVERDVAIYSFDTEWRERNVGHFIEGGSAKGVTTVKFQDDVSGIEEQIEEAKAELKSASKEVDANQDAQALASKRLDEVLNRVFNGKRRELEAKCTSLKGTRFNRRAIRTILESGTQKLISEDAVAKHISIVTNQSPGSVPALPELNTTWAFTDELWDEVSAEPSTNLGNFMGISDWVREGLERHKADDSCEFCGGNVAQERLDELTQAILWAQQAASSAAREELEKCKRNRSELEEFIANSRRINLSDSIYSGELPLIQTKVINNASSVLQTLDASVSILQEHIKNPTQKIQTSRPIVEYDSLKSMNKELLDAHATAQEKISQHIRNQDISIEALKSHCCAFNGQEWEIAEAEMKKASASTYAAEENEQIANSKLRNLQRSVSTTADTAEFLDRSLALILGERSLRVTEGAPGEGYRITRNNQRAAGMSEGEKKLVSLLYFCAEFRAEERRSKIPYSLLLFDDLGSELDEPRLLAIDRFVSTHFSDPKPLSTVYFTHSHQYLKILQSRLGNKAIETKKNGTIRPPSSIFFEVFKSGFSNNLQSTCWRKWDHEAVQLTNDYWLSFYMVLKAFDDLATQNAPSLGTGNFCRKVLEGFTEFRAPGPNEFGARLDNLLKKHDTNLSPALSKIVNGLSHSDLSKTGGVLSRHEVEIAVVQTLGLLKNIDPDHFGALLSKFRKKNETKDVLDQLDARMQSGL